MFERTFFVRWSEHFLFVLFVVKLLIINWLSGSMFGRVRLFLGVNLLTVKRLVFHFPDQKRTCTGMSRNCKLLIMGTINGKNPRR
jgi:hypothetical protein